MPPLFDRVYLHEAAHAAMDGARIPELLSEATGGEGQVFLEELLAWFLESHAIEVVDAVSRSLGRPVCVENICAKGER